MLLVTLALKTLLSISQNGINQITLNKHLGKHLNMDIINASISLSSFLYRGSFQAPKAPNSVYCKHLVIALTALNKL